MSLFTGLTLIFVAAKLFGLIQWSWWLVFLPSFIGIAIGIGLLLAVVIAKALK